MFQETYIFLMQVDIFGCSHNSLGHDWRCWEGKLWF